MLSLTSPSLTRRAARALALSAVVGATIAPAAAHAESTLLSTEQRAAPVAAWNGTVAWSSYDTATGQYRLVVSRDGSTPQAVNVPPSAMPFDVDLGTNRNGSTYAVYTRKAGNSRDVYRLNLATGVEQQLTKLSSPSWSERQPTIFHGQIAFIRHERHRGTWYDVLRIGDTTTGSKGTRALLKVRSTKTAT